MRHHLVQRAAVLMHFSPEFARRVYAGERVPLVDDEERALLCRVDARAFRTDPERPLRLLAALLEEYPVSAAVVGAPALHAFLSSSPFENAILRDRLVVDAFGDWLFARAGDVAQIELAVALARRRRARRGRGIARAPGVEVARTAAGTLAFYARALASLGARPHEAVARGGRVEAPPEPAEREHVLVAGAEVSLCGEALFSLLSWAREGRERAALVDEARRLGADDEAAALVDDLVKDGLLASSGV